MPKDELELLVSKRYQLTYLAHKKEQKTAYLSNDELAKLVRLRYLNDPSSH